MIALNSSTRKLQAFMASVHATTAPTVTVIYHDVSRNDKLDNSEYPRSPQFTTLDGVTEKDICDAPPNGNRHIDYIAIYNASTDTEIFTVCIDDAGTNWIQVVYTVAAGKTLIWTALSNWVVTT
jgi:hypothetical protein